MDDSALLSAAIDIAKQAGQEILEVYRHVGGIGVEYKLDSSPLTEADTRANRVIVAGLQKLDPNIPVLSEESEPVAWEQRSAWQSYWLVDPLDGTKEFISRNDEFTVNIALIRNGQPVLGIVQVPVFDVCYSGLVGEGSFRQLSDGPKAPIEVDPLSTGENSILRVVASRRHGGEAQQAMVHRLEQHFSKVELVNMGSSLKICLLAEGKADFYPRLAPTSEWDTAAAHAILCAAGGQIYRTDHEVLTYNQKEDLLNPYFLAVADKQANWRQLLGE